LTERVYPPYILGNGSRKGKHLDPYEYTPSPFYQWRIVIPGFPPARRGSRTALSAAGVRADCRSRYFSEMRDTAK
jgi:hypothetical protein